MRTGVAFDDVLAAAQAGAAWAFETLYRDLAPAVTGYLRLHGAAEPDDLASETFLGVFRGLSGFAGNEDALRSWVFTIAHRRLVDDWRRRSRRPQLTDDADLALLPGGDAEDDARGAHDATAGSSSAWASTSPAPCRWVEYTRRTIFSRSSSGPARRGSSSGARPRTSRSRCPVMYEFQPSTAYPATSR